MNLEILDPFNQQSPELISHKLTYADGLTSCWFNPKGTHLAAGTHKGVCLIWDMETRGLSRVLTGHVADLSDVSWSRDGRYILTSSADWNSILWDLTTGRRVRTFKFQSPVLAGQIHPLFPNLVAVLTQGGMVTVIRLPPAPTFMISPQHPRKETRTVFPTEFHDPLQFLGTCDERLTCLCFEPTRQVLLLGCHRGSIVVLDVKTLTMTNIVQRATSAGIRSLQFAHTGRDLVVNVNDRTIRVFVVLPRVAKLNHDDKDGDGNETGDIQLNSEEDGPLVKDKVVATTKEIGETLDLDHEQKFMDSVNRSQWAHCCFSAYGEYVIGGSLAKHTHHIFIWNRHVGNLIKMLEGEKDGLVDVSSHPYKPILASVGASGDIYIWGAGHMQQYSALAPDFEEMEDNDEYDERESEFDEEPDDPPPKRPSQALTPDSPPPLPIDPTTIQPVNAFDDTTSLPLPIDLSGRQVSRKRRRKGSVPRSASTAGTGDLTGGGTTGSDSEEGVEWRWHIPV
ncbi:WD40-repeat-containing domain protein [Phlyctochytrium arcticum]|nr:WD40-repeat-containing domain protein [Phlyctochytrium arcticum]